jgi:hypothetical protein
MANSVTDEAYQYRVRAGTPMPIGSSTGRFKWHTFMAEKSLIDIYLYTQKLPSSSQFRGQGGNLMSASFSRLSDIGGDTFQGKAIHSPTYIDESNIGASPDTSTDKIAFIECTSLSISYNIMGIATVSFTIVHNSAGLKTVSSITAGDQTFRGFVSNADVTPITNTNGWYESHVTLITTTGGAGGISLIGLGG